MELIGSFEIDGPKAPMITASTPMPAPVPSNDDFQSRAVPAANTIVVASTASTAQARNTAINRAKPVMSKAYFLFELLG